VASEGGVSRRDVSLLGKGKKVFLMKIMLTQSGWLAKAARRGKPNYILRQLRSEKEEGKLEVRKRFTITSPPLGRYKKEAAIKVNKMQLVTGKHAIIAEGKRGGGITSAWYYKRTGDTGGKARERGK